MPYQDKQKQKEYQQKWYQSHKKEHNRRSKNKTDEKRKALRKFKDVPCADCHESYPYYVMQFDHREDEVKVDVIARMVAKASWQAILDEVKKCDVVCANCHAIRTWERKQRYKNNGVRSSEEERLLVEQKVGISKLLVHPTLA